uniref:Uncharacterized protein n=1 Tax=Oryza brachyantha TaxID=4533 RepID=J3MLC6_ORYBR
MRSELPTTGEGVGAGGGCNELHCLGGMRLHVLVAKTPSPAGALGGGTALAGTGVGAIVLGAGGEVGVLTLNLAGL